MTTESIIVSHLEPLAVYIVTAAILAFALFTRPRRMNAIRDSINDTRTILAGVITHEHGWNSSMPQLEQPNGARNLIDDEAWADIEPLLPKTVRRSQRGRPRTPDRVALAGIVFVLRSGIAWQNLPQELGCSGTTCWRRLRDWQQAGIWPCVWQRIERTPSAGRAPVPTRYI